MSVRKSSSLGTSMDSEIFLGVDLPMTDRLVFHSITRSEVAFTCAARINLPSALSIEGKCDA
jgi:hypothetical protein